MTGSESHIKREVRDIHRVSDKDLNKSNSNRENMSIFGRGQGFLGLPKSQDPWVMFLVSALGTAGIIYFFFINQYILVLGTVGVALAIIGSILARN